MALLIKQNLAKWTMLHLINFSVSSLRIILKEKNTQSKGQKKLIFTYCTTSKRFYIFSIVYIRSFFKCLRKNYPLVVTESTLRSDEMAPRGRFLCVPNGSGQGISNSSRWVLNLQISWTNGSLTPRTTWTLLISSLTENNQRHLEESTKYIQSIDTSELSAVYF